MKIKNPFYIDPVATYALSVKQAVSAYLQANATLKTIEFSKVRADFPGEAVFLTDGVIAEICKTLGVAVVD